MNKAALVEKIVEALGDELERMAKAARASHAEATDPQSKAEHKYDTRGLEAAYLAGGQARKVAEFDEAIGLFRKLRLREFGKADLIDLGALVQIEMRGGKSWYFVGPRRGGLEVELDGEEITVITPEAPLGAALMEKKAGMKFMFGSGRDAVSGKILAVE